MKNSTFFLLLILLTNCISGQEKLSKPPLDTSVFNNWPSISRSSIPMISNNGRYLLYAVEHIPLNGQTTFLKDLNTKIEQKIVAARNAFFSIDSRKIVYRINDTLFIADIKSGRIEKRFNTTSYREIVSGKNQFIVMQMKGSDNEMLIYNVINSSQRSHLGVVEYIISDNEQRLFFKSKCENDSDCISLFVASLTSDKTENLWNGRNFRELILNNDGSQFAFIVDGNRSAGKCNELYLGDVAHKSIRKIADDSSSFVNYKSSLESLIGFNNNNKGIFVKLETGTIAQPAKARSEVWSASDLYFMRRPADRLLIANFNIERKQFIALQRIGEQIILPTNKPNDTIAYISFRAGDLAEENWNSASREKYYRIVTMTGKRDSVTEIRENSPTGRFEIGHEYSSGDIILYDQLTHRKNNVSKLLTNAATFEKENGESVLELKVEAWLPNDLGVLLNDGYDIWQIDLHGIEQPKNLTNGYGFKHRIAFYILRYQLPDGVLINTQSAVVLNAFNENTKESGFYTMKIGVTSSPSLLTMGPYHYFLITRKYNNHTNSVNPKKTIHLFLSNSSTSCYNVFMTDDFKKFKQASDLKPEKAYNWLTSELVDYTTIDGKSSKAIVYKPENFDSSKSYPIIMYYYEKKSHFLNTYMSPEPCNGGLNIPWFVSNGYVVCTPDIEFIRGNPGGSSYNSVMGCTNKIKGYRWVDSTRIGLFGHSFGGYQTNFILTRSSFFAAAYSGAGIANLFSFYGSIGASGTPMSPIMEHGQMRIFATPWNNRDLYIKNSPIFFSDKINTPLLLMSNKGDRSVPYAQSLELFIALRRLGKTAWLIQYENEGHTITQYQNAVDFTIKITQFFDFYLKNKMRPAWMEEDIR